MPRVADKRKSQDAEENSDPVDYEVEYFLGVRYDREVKAIQYFVKWANFGTSKASWENAGDVNAKDLAEPFNDAYQYLHAKYVKRGGKGYITEDDPEDSEDDEDGGGDKSVVKSEEDEEFAVDEILGIKLDPGRKIIRYLVKWHNYRHAANTWERAELMNCPWRIRKFVKAQRELEDRRKIIGNPGRGPGVIRRVEPVVKLSPAKKAGKKGVVSAKVTKKVKSPAKRTRRTLPLLVDSDTD